MAAQPGRTAPGLLQEDRDWSTLPQELLECVGTMLPSRREAVKFRSVCPAWRAALPFAKYIAPLLMLSLDPADSPDGAVTFYTVADGGESTFTRHLPSLRGKRVCGSSRGWLALVDGDEAAAVTLLNPLTGATVQLPPADERVVGASIRHLMVSSDGIPSVMLRTGNGGYAYVRLDEMKKRAFRQIVLSSSSPGSGGCVAMAALADSGTVAFCRVGVDGAWTLLATDLPPGPVTSVVHLRGSTFLAMFDGGRRGVGEISICNVAAGAAPTATRLHRFNRSPKLTTWARSYLEVNGELYAVVTVDQGSTRITHVYSCNALAVKPRWTRVSNTQGLTFFMSSKFTAGYGGAASVSGFKENCVYCDNPDRFELEIIDIANGSSELFQPACHKKIQGSAGALCWIQPNHWT